MLNTEHEIHQTWGGHDPILRALVKMGIGLAVECGCGLYSTGILSGAERLLTIEHDPRWAREMQEAIAAPGWTGARCAVHEWIVDEVDGIDNGTPRQAISEAVRADLDARYARYAEEFVEIDLLFVDTFTAARVPAIQHFGPLARIIAIHDTEADHPMGYGLGECEEVLAGMWRYSYQPHGQTAEFHRFTWTEIFSREPLDQRALTEAAAPAAMALWGQRPWLVGLGKGPTHWSR